MVEHLSVDAGTRDQVVHPVEAADERALAAARWSDQRGDDIAVNVEVDVLHRYRRAVTHREVSDVEDNLPLQRRPLAGALHHLDRGHGNDRIGWCQLLLRHRDSLRRLRASTAFDTTLSTSTNAISTSAAAHALE